MKLLAAVSAARQLLLLVFDPTWFARSPWAAHPLTFAVGLLIVFLALTCLRMRGARSVSPSVHDYEV